MGIPGGDCRGDGRGAVGPVSDRPTVPDVMPLVWALYDTEHGSCGGHLHITLDDGNIEDSNIEFCIREAAKENCEPCLTIGRLLQQMTKTQRSVVYKRAYEKGTW